VYFHDATGTLRRLPAGWTDVVPVDPSPQPGAGRAGLAPRPRGVWLLRRADDGAVHLRHGALWPTYVCQRAGIARGEPICQGIPGRALDEAVGHLLMETVTPHTLEMTLAVQQELQARWGEADRLRHQQVDRARYEAELARRRYLRVDPDHYPSP
jgi:hypothetical protein